MVFFFFFQAEDGIRDIGVTGVQTCALPISEYAATVAGRGISLWIAIQSLSQLDAIYGTKRAEALRDNLDTQIYYRPASLGTAAHLEERLGQQDRKSTRLNSSHANISYAVFCLKKKKINKSE